MEPVSWTRLEGTALWEEARAAYAHPPGRTYHGFGHVACLYRHAAQTFCLPYDPALDLAVLAHDALIGGPQAEARSRIWLLNRRNLVDEALPCLRADGEPVDALLDRAGHFILATEHHPTAPETAAIVLLDLADFLDAEVSRANSAALRDEARALRGLNDESWTAETLSYLAGLAKSLDPDTVREDEARSNLLPQLRAQIQALREGVDRVATELAERTTRRSIERS